MVTGMDWNSNSSLVACQGNKYTCSEIKLSGKKRSFTAYIEFSEIPTKLLYIKRHDNVQQIIIKR